MDLRVEHALHMKVAAFILLRRIHRERHRAIFIEDSHIYIPDVLTAMRAATTTNAPAAGLVVCRGCCGQSRGRLRKVHTGLVEGLLLIIVGRQLGWLALFLFLMAISFRFVTVLGSVLTSTGFVSADLGAIMFIVVGLFAAALRLVTHSRKAIVELSEVALLTRPGCIFDCDCSIRFFGASNR